MASYSGKRIDRALALEGRHIMECMEAAGVERKEMESVSAVELRIMVQNLLDSAKFISEAIERAT